MANAGEIRGLKGLGKVSNWDVTPYAVGKYQHDNLSGDGNTLGEFGGDISYRLAPNMNATLSVNTDFAETEVDTRQLNFTRFSLIYPEKRDFSQRLRHLQFWPTAIQIIVVGHAKHAVL